MASNHDVSGANAWVDSYLEALVSCVVEEEEEERACVRGREQRHKGRAVWVFVLVAQGPAPLLYSEPASRDARAHA